MNQTPDDKALNEYLSGQSPLSARYRELPADDVPPELDAKILAQASAAISNPATHKKLERWRRWSVPATLAATFVLVVSLVIKNNTPQLNPAQKSVMTSIAESSGNPIPESREQPESDARKERQTVTVDLTAATPQLYSDRAEPEMTLESPPTLKLDMPPSPAPIATAREAEQRVADQTALQAVVAEKPAAPAPIMAPSPVASLNDEGPRLAKAAEPDRGVANRVQSARRASEPVAQQSKREADPKLWLEYIRELRKENKKEDADREWKTFRERYPDYKVEDNDSARGNTP